MAKAAYRAPVCSAAATHTRTNEETTSSAAAQPASCYSLEADNAVSGAANPVR